MNSDLLDYGDDGLPVRARGLIDNRTRFTIEITGEAFVQLSPYVVDGQIADLAKLSLKPKLQGLLIILLLAKTKEQEVYFQVKQDRIHVQVGT